MQRGRASGARAAQVVRQRPTTGRHVRGRLCFAGERGERCGQGGTARAEGGTASSGCKRGRRRPGRGSAQGGGAPCSARAARGRKGGGGRRRKGKEGEKGKRKRKKRKREREGNSERERERLARFAAAVGHARVATSGPSVTVAGGFGGKRCARKTRKGNREVGWGLGVWTEKDLERFEPIDKKRFWKNKFLAGDLIGRIFGMLHFWTLPLEVISGI